MAAATQQAPEKAPYRAPASNNRVKEEKVSALARIPRAAGMAIMALLLVISLFAGNFRALQRATPKDFLRQGDVKTIVEDRLDAAGNVLTVARRAGFDEDVYNSVSNIINEMESAEYAWEIGLVDQDLTAAVSELVVAAKERLDDEGRTMLMSAADDFAEQGSFLRQEAREFNEKAEEAMELYEKLPTKFLWEEPDMYLGL